MRKRQLDPVFFEDPKYSDCSYLARWLLLGLICVADREGRLRADPLLLTSLIVPDENHKKVERALEELEECKFVQKYVSGKREYYQLLSPWDGQNPHPNERKSVLPEFRAESMSLECNYNAITSQCNSNVSVDLDLDLNKKKNGQPKKSKRKKPPTPPEIPDSLNTPEFTKVWGEWLAYRRDDLKKPASATAQKQQLKDLSEWGVPKAVAAIRHSMKNDWQGIFPKPDGDAPGGRSRLNGRPDNAPHPRGVSKSWATREEAEAALRREEALRKKILEAAKREEENQQRRKS